MNKFCVLITFLTLIAAISCDLSEDQRTKLREFAKQCMEISAVDPARVQQIKKGEFGNDPKLKTFLGCVLKKIGFLNDAGEIQADIAKAKRPKGMSEETFNNLLGKCKDQKGNGADETAYLLFKCYWENSPNHDTILSI